MARDGTPPGSETGPPSDTGPRNSPRRGGTFDALQYRNYRLLWFGQASHAGALWMEQIARPWLVLEITGSNAAHVGGVVAMRTLPQLVFGLWAGVIADWFDRKTILLGTKLGVLTLNIVFAALLVSGNLELWHIYATSFIRGSFMAFDQPARQSLIAATVPRETVTNALALMSATQNFMRIAGTAASGFVISVLGVDGAFIIIAVVYAGAVAVTAMLDVPTHERPQRGGLRTMTASLVEGARYAATVPAIRGVMILSLVYFTFGMSWMQVYAPLFADTVLKIGAFGFGVLIAFSGLGALAGTFVIARRQPTNTGFILPVVVVTMGASLVAFSLATYLPRPVGIVVPFAIIMVVGVMQTAYMSLSNATMLTAAPEAMRGRVISLLSLDRAMVTLGASGAGLLAASLGVQVAQIVYGAVCLVAGIVVFLMAKGLREYHTHDLAEEPAREGERAAVAGG
ncbi:MAG: MFS transporter [Dehalococcoidia bacterium]|nr:MFS transporter [Dehalococcoidia bacterium]